MAPGTPVTLQLQAQVISPQTLANTATVTADQFDPIPLSNSATTSLVPRQADLVVGMAVDNPQPDVGEVVTFVLSLTNTGPDDAGNIQVTSPVPGGFQLVTANAGSGTYNPVSGLWTIPTLGAGGTTTLAFQARLGSPTADNAVAQVLGANTFDTNPGNDVATARVSPRSADLSVTMVAPATADVGPAVPIRIIVANAGPDLATGVVVRISLPDGLRPTASSPAQGTYDPATGLWTVGAIPVGGVLELSLEAEVVASGALAVSALIAQAGQVDPASENNTAASVIAARPAPPPATGRLGGIGFSDLDGDGVRSPSEPGLPDVAITLRGIDTQGRLVQRLVTTAPDGTFEFAGLPPGVYELARSGPGGGRIAGIVLLEGGALLNHLFPIAVGRSRLAGSVYYDLNHNGRFDTPDFGIANATVILSGLSDLGVLVQRQVVTDADGSYAFDNLPPGTYSLAEVQPARFHDYRDSIGTLGGTSRNDRFEGIVLDPGASGMGYNFGELQGRGSHLRRFVIYLGNAEARLRARRALDPARFDATYPRYASALAQGCAPVGQRAQARARLLQHDLPTAGTRRVILSSLRPRAQARNGTIGPAD